METRFRIQLFGSFQIARGDGASIRIDSRKAQALLAYLVRQQRPPEREHIAVLLWSNLTGARARRNLSRELSLLNTCLHDCFQSGYHSVAWAAGADVWVDAAALELLTVDTLQAAMPLLRRANYDECHSLQQELPPPLTARLTEAVELYRGEFLAGFYLDDCPEFETWLLFEREQWRLRITTILDLLIAHHTLRQEYPQAIALARRWLTFEPWHEDPHRHLIQLLAQSDRRVEALNQYEICRRILSSELGVAPSEHTTALYEQICNGARRQVASPRIETAAPADRRAPAGSGGAPATPEHDWDGAPAVQRLYGCQSEVGILKRWIADERRRVVALFGMGGVGKTLLASHVAREVAPGFEAVIWRSLRNAPPLDVLLRSCAASLSAQPSADVPPQADEQLALLFNLLRRRRCLLVLDHYESILQPAVHVGRYLPGYEVYGQLLQRAVETPHQSCIVLTSREQPRELPVFAGAHPAPAASLQVRGLSTAAAQELLGQLGWAGATAEATRVANAYSGNPLLLQHAAETVRELFGGDSAAFLRANTPLLEEMREPLEQQWMRLSALEQDIALWLALAYAPVSLSTLQHNLVGRVPDRDLLDALRSLLRRSLAEQQDQHFTVPNIVREYACDHLVGELYAEIVAGTCRRLGTHALAAREASEQGRASLERRIAQPLVERLLAELGRDELLCRLRAVHTAPASGWRQARGYACENALCLLHHLDCGPEGQ